MIGHQLFVFGTEVMPGGEDRTYSVVMASVKLGDVPVWSTLYELSIHQYGCLGVHEEAARRARSDFGRWLLTQLGIKR